MPSHDLLLYFQKDLTCMHTWRINGLHYSKTLEGWLRRQDANRDKARARRQRGWQLETSACSSPGWSPTP